MQITLDTQQLVEARLDIDDEELLDEIRVYLDAVDVFRGEGCEPDWRAELG